MMWERGHSICDLEEISRQPASREARPAGLAAPQVSRQLFSRPSSTSQECKNTRHSTEDKLLEISLFVAQMIKAKRDYDPTTQRTGP